MESIPLQISVGSVKKEATDDPTRVGRFTREAKKTYSLRPSIPYSRLNPVVRFGFGKCKTVLLPTTRVTGGRIPAPARRPLV